VNRKPLRRDIPLARRVLNGKVKLSDSARTSGIHIQATRGSGKSTLEACIALADAARGKPVVLFEAQGGLVEQLLWRLRFLHPDTRKAIVSRIVYVDMSGKRGSVSGWPLMYRLPGDTFYDIARRFPELVKRLDPDLTNAPIMGANALDFLGTYTGMALFAMGCQYTEATELLDNPLKWADRLREAGQKHPEAKPATDFFLNHYPNMPALEQRNLTMTLRAKLSPFILNPTLKAMFGASSPDIDWEEVAEQRKLVILDFQDITADDDIRFKMRWTFSYLWEYIKKRQDARDKPISVIIDELSYLLSMRSGSDDLLSADLDNFINKDMRYRNVWLTLAHQELYQIPDRMKKTLLSMGTQIIGQTSDRETADLLGQMYLDYDPFWVKKEIPRWAVMTHSSPGFMKDSYGREHIYSSSRQHIEVVDYVTEEFTLDEQLEMASSEFRKISQFHFLLAHSGREGTLARHLTKVNIQRQVEAVPFPNKERVNQDRDWLIERSGTPIATIHEQIQKRQLPQPSTYTRRSG
jgi:hypothetical protein